MIKSPKPRQRLRKIPANPHLKRYQNTTRPDADSLKAPCAWRQKGKKMDIFPEKMVVMEDQMLHLTANLLARKKRKTIK